MIKLEATRRSLNVRARTLRRRGLIPGVVYGPRLDPIPVALPESAVQRLFSEVTSSTMVELHVDGNSYRVFVKEVQIDSLSGKVLHLDFYVPEAGRTLEIAIPVRIVGEALGVKEGGLLEVVHAEIPVEAPPEKVPPEIVVDVTKLGVDEAILVRDIPWPEGVRPLLPPEDAVVVVVPPRKEVAAEAGPAEAPPPGETKPSPPSS